MPRHLEFDPEHALDEGLAFIWSRGYEATSLAELLSAMGLSRSSFYATWGDKASFMDAAMERYAAGYRSLIDDIDAEHSGLHALRTFLRTSVSAPDEATRRRGCLVVNSILEFDGVDPEFHRRSVDFQHSIERPIRRWLDAGRRAGDVRSDLEPPALSELVLTTTEGLRIGMREGLSRAALDRRIDTLLLLISAPPIDAASTDPRARHQGETR